MNIKVTFDDGGDTNPPRVFELSEGQANILHRALVLKENADDKYDDYNSLHEAYGILKEEISEFEKEVFLKQALRHHDNVSAELADIIAVCIRAADVDISR